MKIENNVFIIEKERGEEVHSIEIKDFTEVVVLGDPPAESENEAENTHNCDQMGCGTSHVLFRRKQTGRLRPPALGSEVVRTAE